MHPIACAEPAQPTTQRPHVANVGPWEDRLHRLAFSLRPAAAFLPPCPPPLPHSRPPPLRDQNAAAAVDGGGGELIVAVAAAVQSSPPRVSSFFRNPSVVPPAIWTSCPSERSIGDGNLKKNVIADVGESGRAGRHSRRLPPAVSSRPARRRSSPSRPPPLRDPAAAVAGDRGGGMIVCSEVILHEPGLPSEIHGACPRISCTGSAAPVASAPPGRATATPLRAESAGDAGFGNGGPHLNRRPAGRGSSVPPTDGHRRD